MIKLRDIKKQIDRQNKFVAEKYDRFETTFPKGKKEVYRDFAKQQGKSLNSLINELLEREINNAQ